MAKSMNDLAAECKTTPRNIRKFVRKFERANDRGDSLPGKGKRYALDARTFSLYRKEFLAAQALRPQDGAESVASDLQEITPAE